MAHIDEEKVLPVNNKLIMLYLLDQIGMPVTETRVIKIILENKLMNYFYVVQSLEELIEDKYIFSTSINGKPALEIANAGSELIKMLSSSIPVLSKSVIDHNCIEIKKNVKKETQIYADYIPESDDQFIVECKILEDDFPLFELKLTVGSKDDAKFICKNWEEKASSTYREIIDKLLEDKK
jgi:hypothetical protein